MGSGAFEQAFANSPAGPRQYLVFDGKARSRICSCHFLMNSIDMAARCLDSLCFLQIGCTARCQEGTQPLGIFSIRENKPLDKPARWVSVVCDRKLPYYGTETGN